MVSFVQENAANYFEDSKVPHRDTRPKSPQAHCFIAGDGLPFVIHLSSPEKFWVGLTDAVGRPEMRDDLRFADRPARTQHYDELHDALAEAFAAAPRDEWIGKLRENDVPCSPLNTLEEVFQDPQVQALGMSIDLERPGGTPVRVTGSAIRLSATPPTYDIRPPLLGEHNEEVLRSLGYDTEAIQELMESQAV
jgi:formyl-CoA transferase